MHNIPLDLNAETFLTYYPREKRSVELKGSHKRNAYEDIASVVEYDGGNLHIVIARNGLYDLLPECLFHPIDRFDNIPANEYKDRFKEECEQQQLEEDNARKYFRPFDTILIELSAIIADAKNDIQYAQILDNIICDQLPSQYRNNRFVIKTKEYMSQCRHIRGNKGLLSLLLRRILSDEHIHVDECRKRISAIDSQPRYSYRLNDGEFADPDCFLGNEFEEDITIYDVQYWNEDECGVDFMTFVSEMRVFEDFLNEYFMSVESQIKFNISTMTLPVRLSDDVDYTFLDYNTNI